MNSHLRIDVDGRPLSVNGEFAIDLEYKNPLFNDAEAYSYPARIPLDGNRHLVKNVDDIHSPLRPVFIENKKVRLFVDGLPFFDGQIKVSDDEELDNVLSLNIDGRETLRDLVADLDCQDIPVKDELIIGHKIKDVNADFFADVDYTFTFKYDLDLEKSFVKEGADGAITLRQQQTASTSFSPQALGFSWQENINVDKPYPEMPYCNARVCYKHYGLDDEGETSQTIQMTDTGPYLVLGADRPQSGICFYVLYFLDCLFHHLGLDWDNSELMKVEDLKRLCFFTTKCGYDSINEPENPISTTIDELNSILQAHNCGSRIEPGTNVSSINSVRILAGAPVIKLGVFPYLGSVSGKKLKNPRLIMDMTFITNQPASFVLKDDDKLDMNLGVFIDSIQASVNNISLSNVSYKTCDMAANSENFPAVSVDTILDSLENMFGIRFIYDAETRVVKAVFVRDMFRADAPARNLNGTVLSMNKVSESISGVFVGYGDESDAKEQKNNLRDQKRDYDTSFDYVDFPSPEEKKTIGVAAAYTTVIQEKAYAKIVTYGATNQNNTLYIDSTTGNCYRVKINADAEEAQEQDPAWFQVAQFKGVEFGNCSKANEEHILRFTTSFQPIMLNDVNAEAVKWNCESGTPLSDDKMLQPRLAAYCDVDMEHEYVTQILKFPFNTTGLEVTLNAVLNLYENYDVKGSENGNSPLQTYDWGLCIAIMRGGGSNATVQKYDSNFDGFNNARYRSVAGLYALTADTMDMLGNEYDYNGDEEGLGRGERFSLFPRAYRTPSWAPDGIYTAPDGTVIPLCRDDVHTTVPDASASGSRVEHTYYRNRGWVDRFMLDFAEWLLTRRKYRVKMLCSVAAINDIRNHWSSHWIINGERGIINSVSVNVNNLTGIKELEIEFFTL